MNGFITRRELLRFGGTLGLSTAGLQQALAAQPAVRASTRSFGQAKSVIVLFLGGGPPQHETWDPKPDAASDIRGDFGAIKSSLSGLYVGELMPKLAKQAHRWSVLRAMRTEDNAHSASGYYMLTGRPHQPKNRENATPVAPNRWPSMGGVVRQLLPDRSAFPGAVTLPEHIWNDGMITWPGQDAGFLGRTSDPWLIHCDPSQPNFKISGLGLLDGMTQSRLQGRLSLQKDLDSGLAQLGDSLALQTHDIWNQTAVDLLTSTATRNAFDIDAEAPALRERYGNHRFGQSALLARRLVESGVSLVQVNWTREPGRMKGSPMWDTHGDHSRILKDRLMPPMDAACSALIDDLHDRGLLDETLVVWMGEFGRTPKFNARGGRDHWGNVFSVALAGGGIRPGIVHGASDINGGEPKDGVVRPENLIATIFHCLGLSPEATISDHLGRPHHIATAGPVEALI